MKKGAEKENFPFLHLFCWNERDASSQPKTKRDALLLNVMVTISK